MSTTVARSTRNALIGLGVCLLLLLLAAAAGLGYVERQIGKVERIDGVFEGLGPRPARPTEGPAADALNILLLGTDRRSEVATTGDRAMAPAWIPGEQRSDTMMLVHVDADREGMTVVSLPRDSWVDVPGHGMAKINAAYSYGGPSLAVHTVERLTGVRVDHLAVIDWEGFREMTDEVGGVTVTIPETVYDSARDITWTSGQHTLDGQQALDYVGQRYGLPGGDLDRVRRQQEFLATLLEETLQPKLRASPRLALDLLGTVSSHLSVDAEWSTKGMASLVLSLRGLRTPDIRYLTAPVGGLGWEGDQSVVHLDRARCNALWQALREDQVDAWASHRPDAAGAP